MRRWIDRELWPVATFVERLEGTSVELIGAESEGRGFVVAAAAVGTCDGSWLVLVAAGWAGPPSGPGDAH